MLLLLLFMYKAEEEEKEEVVIEAISKSWLALSSIKKQGYAAEPPVAEWIGR